ncbi:TonB-dependent receptor [candidate division KSB1 bacterium]|nr:TonB-dependent receptor [candidate division KSB1 bacterium]RQW05063.1 MAG: TonB-dependent receptor [candidate division KSB1 bacterium]
MKKCLFLSAVLTASALANIHLEGLVLDANSHQQVDGVNVYVENSSYGAITDVSGTFRLDLPADFSGARVTFRHISYEIQSIAVDSLLTVKTPIYLVPRVIPLQGVQVLGASGRHKIDIARDIPQSIRVLEATRFDIRGYVDAGDFLKTEPSIQVQEEMSGKKTISIRGGNADDVVLLYNGVRMNSPLDNVFDFSLIDLENLQRFEIIKGSNTSLYGPEAFSGVVNVVPQVERDYTARLSYRVGTYNTEHVNAQLYKKFGRQHASYSFKDASQRRRFIDAASDAESIKNDQIHHTAILHSDIGDDNDVDLMYVHARLDYKNGRDGEDVGQTNDIGSLTYSGAVGPVRQLHFMAAFKSYCEQQDLNYAEAKMARRIDDDGLQLNLDKTFEVSLADVLFGYSYHTAHVDFLDDRAHLFSQQAEIDRSHHGLVGIAKTDINAGDSFLQNFHVDLSLRHDRVHDNVSDIESAAADGAHLQDNDWDATHFKFSTSVDGAGQNVAFKGFLNFGANTKFPTIVQQLSVPLGGDAATRLRPEGVTSTEAGLELFKESASRGAIDGWHAEGVFFRNYYTDKFRPISTPGIPVVFYDNVPTAEIFGLEASFNVYLLKKKIDLEYGLARYNISEKSAFPFKSDFKQTLDVTVNHMGFSILLHWFSESEGAGWIRTFAGGLAEVTLPPFANCDVHISRTFRLAYGKVFFSLSGRNLLDRGETALQGLAIRDKRAYLTVGAQI